MLMFMLMFMLMSGTPSVLKNTLAHSADEKTASVMETRLSGHADDGFFAFK